MASVKGRKIRNNDYDNKLKKDIVKSNKELDKKKKVIDKSDSIGDEMSIISIIIIVLLCFVVGISVGFILYKIAINNSAAIIIDKMLL